MLSNKIHQNLKIKLLLVLLQFFTGWWLIIDVQVTCSDSFKGAYHLCGVFGTLSLFM